MWRAALLFGPLLIACSSSNDTSDGGGGAPACPSVVEPFGADPTQGESFPDLELTACDGTKATLDVHRCSGKITLYSIGAGWCEPCKAETPLLQATRDKLKPEGVEIVQILFQDAKANPATTLFCQIWSDTYGLTMPLYIDPTASTLDYFDQVVAPLNLIVDRNGKVLWSVTGVIPQDLEQTLVGFLPQ